MGVNKVILVGHVGKDPEVRHLESGVSVANFTIATNETYKNKNGEKMENTEWHNIVIWDKLVDVVEKYVIKGMQLYLEGKIKSRSWDDKDGNKKYITEIYAHKLEMLSKIEGNTNTEREQAPLPGEDDLPF